MKAYLLSFVYYNDRNYTKHYKLIYAVDFEHAKMTLSREIIDDICNVTNETIFN